MSDWEFLYDMNEQGYSPEAILDAAGSGLAPWDHVEVQEIKTTQKHKHRQQKRIVLNKCRVVFFDLEFYVPSNSQFRSININQLVTVLLYFDPE